MNFFRGSFPGAVKRAACIAEPRSNHAVVLRRGSLLPRNRQTTCLLRALQHHHQNHQYYYTPNNNNTSPIWRQQARNFGRWNWHPRASSSSSAVLAKKEAGEGGGVRQSSSSSASTTTAVEGAVEGADDPHFNTTASPDGKQKEKLVLLGTGWAGFKFLQDIDTRRYKVTVVSPRNHFLFTPLLASASVGGSTLESICEPVRPVCAERRAKFYEGRAVKVDTQNHLVQCSTLDERPFYLKYDKLVISVGYQANDFGIPNLDQHAFFMKETGDAKKLHDHLLRRFEEASFLHILDGDEHLSKEEEEQIKKTLSFVVVGGGPTGTELCGELSDFLTRDASKRYPHLSQYWSVRLIDALPNILAPFQDPEISAHALEHLTQKQGVHVHLSEFVDSVTANSIALKSGKKFDFSTLVWCAGIKPLPFVRDLSVQMNERGTQILTDRNLRTRLLPPPQESSSGASSSSSSSSGSGVFTERTKRSQTGRSFFSTTADGKGTTGEEETIYAIGDCATIEDFWLPQTAQIAGQQGTYLAQALSSSEPHDHPPFQNQDRGSLAYLGGTAAVYKTPTVIGDYKLPNLFGKLGWFTWRSAYWSMQLSNRNRLMLGSNWFMNYLFGRDLTRFGGPSDPVGDDSDAEEGAGKDVEERRRKAGWSRDVSHTTWKPQPK